MNLYLLSQNEYQGYDTYDAIVVAAESEEYAREIHPYTGSYMFTNEQMWSCNSWVRYEDRGKVKVTLLGKAVKGTESGVILASFNAG